MSVLDQNKSFVTGILNDPNVNFDLYVFGIWATVMNEVWTKPEGDEYYFKKAHAIAYAAAVVVQMNLICERISYEYG